VRTEGRRNCNVAMGDRTLATYSFVGGFMARRGNPLPEYFVRLNISSPPRDVKQM
jgi:hypothetical protein